MRLTLIMQAAEFYGYLLAVYNRELPLAEAVAKGFEEGSLECGVSG